jgi:hypothetical protein
MIFRNGEKVIGEMANTTFVKVCDYQKHHLHNYHAWAIDAEVVKQLEAHNCEKIQIRLKGNGDYFTIPFDVFLEKAFKLNHGFGEQMAVADEHWTKHVKGQGKLFGD